MNRTIWKFQMPEPDESNVFHVPMPAGAKPLSVGFQAGRLCVWAEVDAKRPTVTHLIHLVPTGFECLTAKHVRMLGRVEATGLFNNSLVFHAYYLGERE